MGQMLSVSDIDYLRKLLKTRSHYAFAAPATILREKAIRKRLKKLTSDLEELRRSESRMSSALMDARNEITRLECMIQSDPDTRLREKLAIAETKLAALAEGGGAERSAATTTGARTWTLTGTNLHGRLIGIHATDAKNKIGPYLALLRIRNKR